MSKKEKLGPNFIAVNTSLYSLFTLKHNQVFSQISVWTRFYTLSQRQETVLGPTMSSLLDLTIYHAWEMNRVANNYSSCVRLWFHSHYFMSTFPQHPRGLLLEASVNTYRLRPSTVLWLRTVVNWLYLAERVFFSCGVWLNILSNLFRAAAADPYMGMCILPVMKNELVKCLVVEGRSKHQGCVDGFDLIIPGEVLKNCLDDIEFSYDHTVSFWICSSVAKEIRFWIILY